MLESWIPLLVFFLSFSFLFIPESRLLWCVIRPFSRYHREGEEGGEFSVLACIIPEQLKRLSQAITRKTSLLNNVAGIEGLWIGDGSMRGRESGKLESGLVDFSGVMGGWVP